MKVPLLDLSKQLEPIRSEIIEEITKVVDSCGYILGSEVGRLEEEMAKYTGARYALGVSSGTDALLVSLMALDIKQGDFVLTTPFSFFATAGVIARLNAVPKFVDIDPATFNISPQRIEEFLKDGENADKTKAIIPVHLYGQCADMESILEISKRYGIPVIEDAAQAIGAETLLNGAVKRAGSMGEMGCFSFFPSKNLGGMGDGGCVTTNDKSLFEKLKILRVHGSEPKYYHKIIGGNFRIDTIQAAIILVKLKYLEKWHEMRRKNAGNYDGMLSKTPHVKIPLAVYKGRAQNYHIYNQYVLRVERRDELRKYLADNGITTEIYYPVPFHLQECFEYLGYKKGDYPESEKASNETIALPVYPELTMEMQEYVVSKIEEFYSK